MMTIDADAQRWSEPLRSRPADEANN